MTITTQQHPDGTHHLYCTNYGRTAIAGERLFRGYPRPDIAFSHATKEAAEQDAKKLQDYLLNPPKKSRATKKRQDAFGEVDDLVWAQGL